MKTNLDFTNVDYDKCNQLVAAWMGGTSEHTFYNENGEVEHVLFDMGKERVQNKRYWSDTSMKYHLSWDWLFPVLDKLKMCECNYSIKHQYCTIETWDSEFKVNMGSETTLKSTFKCVVEFIEWFNKNKS